MPTDIIQNPVFPRAIVLGLFGGIGLALTATYSRRGPLIYPVYAAVLASLTLLLSRYATLGFSVRLIAALAGFCAASAVLYAAVGILSKKNRVWSDQIQHAVGRAGVRSVAAVIAWPARSCERATRF
jgi:hypothetical protein